MFMRACTRLDQISRLELANPLDYQAPTRESLGAGRLAGYFYLWCGMAPSSLETGIWEVSTPGELFEC